MNLSTATLFILLLSNIFFKNVSEKCFNNYLLQLQPKRGFKSLEEILLTANKKLPLELKTRDTKQQIFTAQTTITDWTSIFTNTTNLNYVQEIYIYPKTTRIITK